MSQTSQILKGEYAKRVWLDNLDRREFLDFVNPYRTESKIDFAAMEQSGKMPEYHTLAYQTTASHLTRLVLEDFIKDNASEEVSGGHSTSVDWEAQITKLKNLQEKAGIDTKSGGLVDEMEPLKEGENIQKCRLVVGSKDIDVTGKTIEEEVVMYKKGIEEILLDSINKENSSNLSEICSDISKNQKAIIELVEQEFQAQRKMQASTNYQKVLSQN